MDKNITSTSDLASLDCWDYTIELECLRGPQGINTILNTFDNIYIKDHLDFIILLLIQNIYYF